MCRIRILSFARVAVLIGLALAGDRPARGATLHLVIACITEDGTNQRGPKNRWLFNGDRMEELFEQQVAPEQLRIVRVPTSPMTANSVLGFVQQLRGVGPDDALMFYYAGHGGYDEANRQYFGLLPSHDNLYRQTLFNALLQHRPRLMVLVTDCCYVFSPTGEPPILGAQPPAGKAQQTSPLFRALFFKTKGTVDLTSAARDQFSYWVGRDMTGGSLFGSSFRGVLADCADQELTWPQVVHRVRKRTAAEFRAKVRDPDKVPLAGGREVQQTTQTPYAFALPGPRIGIRASVVPGVDGLRIDQTAPPASEVGIKAGDAVLTVDGKPIRSEDDFYDAVLESRSPSFELQIRDGTSGQTRKVTLRPK